MDKILSKLVYLSVGERRSSLGSGNVPRSGNIFVGRRV